MKVGEKLISSISGMVSQTTEQRMVKGNCEIEPGPYAL